MQLDPHETAESPDPQQGPIDCPAIGIGWQVSVTMPASVKPTQLRDRSFQWGMRNLKTNAVLGLTIVAYLYQGAAGKGHIPVTIKPLVGHAQW